MKGNINAVLIQIVFWVYHVKAVVGDDIINYLNIICGTAIIEAVHLLDVIVELFQASVISFCSELACSFAVFHKVIKYLFLVCHFKHSNLNFYIG